MENKFEPLMTVREAAEALALKPNTVYDWVYKKKISYVIVGTRAVRIQRKVVEALLADGEVSAK